MLMTELGLYSVADDKIVDTIFDECDCDARGRVAVSDLIQFMTREAKPPIGR